MMELFFNDLLMIKLMNMLRYLIGMVLFSWHLPKRKCYWPRVLAGAAACMAVSVFLPVINDNVWYVTSLFLIECLLSMTIVKQVCNVGWTLTCYVAAAVYSAEHIASMMDSIISLAQPEMLNYVQVGYVSPIMVVNYFACLAAAYTVIYCLMFRKRHLTDDTLSFNAVLLLLIISLIVNLYVNLFYTNLVPNRDFWASFFEYAANLVGSVFLLRIQSGMMSEGQKDKQLQMTALLWEQAREQYRISKENIEAINIKCHDLKHRLLAVKDKTDEQNYSDIMEAIDSYGSQIETGNEVLDVVFQEKNFQCRKQGIQFTCIIDGAALTFMETTDLYVLFGNLIDNCIEAVSRLPENEVKNIQVTVRRDKGFVIVTTENGYVGQLQWHDGRLRTSKADKNNHGYGMLSIENIVHKYEGRYSISTEEQIFCMNIVFPVKTTAQNAGK